MKNAIIFVKEAFNCSFLKEIILCCLLLFLATAVAWSQPTVSSPWPASQTVCSGTKATFAITATGTPTLLYKWQVSTNGTTWNPVNDGATYSGTTTATLTILSASTSLTGDSYRCTVTNSSGSSNSSAAVLTVSSTVSPFVDPAIFGNTSTHECSNSSSGSVGGFNAAYSYQWFVSSDNGSTWTTINDDAVYSNSTTTTLDIAFDNTFNGNIYKYLVSDPATTGCSAYSGLDTFNLVATPAPQVSSPAIGNICTGTNITFSVPDSSLYYTYQWQSSSNGSTWSNITDVSPYSGTATYSLNITGATTALFYRTITTINSHGISCLSNSASSHLAIKTPPAITVQPADASVCAGAPVSFKVTVSGTSPYTYQWQTDNGTSGASWSVVSGPTTSPATSSTFTIAATSASPAISNYQVYISNACTTSPVISRTANLYVSTSGVCSILPVQLLSFSAQWLNNASTGLSWTIDPGYEVRSFTVQNSEDGVQFSNIAAVNGAKGTTSYSFIDTHPADKNSYRLQLVGAGGDITYSRIIQLTGGTMADRAELAPSVTENAATNLLLSLSHESDILYMLTDISGRTVSRNSIHLANGAHTLPLDISHLPGGVYFVRITSSQGFSKVLTLVKK